jgi:hypothetical protein
MLDSLCLFVAHNSKSIESNPHETLPFGPVAHHLLSRHGDRHPKALCIGGNAQPPPKSAADVYDILFYETEWYKDEIAFHPMTRQAFGINLNIYHGQSSQSTGTNNTDCHTCLRTLLESFPFLFER